MASIKKKSSGGGGGANWMDTYGDMVTLLLCFFVLLYSMSTIDTKKWEWIVQQFNPNSIDLEEPGPVDNGSASKGGDELPATQVDQALTDLYDFLKSYAESNPDASISVSKGDGYVFISFDDTVFFDGDSFEIRPEGAAILDGIIPALTQAAPYIDELEVLGHTAQRVAYEPNPIYTDRRLASQRASEVTAYIQERIPTDMLLPGRLVAKGYGQWRPVSGNGTAEERAKNRRVEMIVTGQEEMNGVLQGSYEQYFTMYETTTGTTGGSE
ncbi:MAG: flagellar motor protein MotB [Acutalibacter sp.]|nr:flagellar motor protein MotB [Acutalibacter sp.]MCI9156560.1 flagellar motor protein MotB [Lawsonibacter sp.]